MLHQLRAQHITAGVTAAAGAGVLHLRLLQHLLAVLVSDSGRWTWVMPLTCLHMNPRKATDVPLLSPSDAWRVRPGIDPYTGPLHFAVYAHPFGFSCAWRRPSDTDQVSEQVLAACSPLLRSLTHR